MKKKSGENNNQKEQLPRPGSILYNMVYGNEKDKKKTINRFKRANKYFMVPLYRIRLLPLLGIGRIFLLIKHIGRKSGKTRYTPVEYMKINNVIYIFASRGKKTHWFRNITANPDKVWIQLGLRSFHARIEVVNDPKEKEEIMRTYLEKRGGPAKSLMGYDKKKDNPKTIDLSNAIDLIEIIRLHKRTE